jgi:hypothetical protein
MTDQDQNQVQPDQPDQLIEDRKADHGIGSFQISQEASGDPPFFREKLETEQSTDQEDESKPYEYPRSMKNKTILGIGGLATEWKDATDYTAIRSWVGVGFAMISDGQIADKWTTNPKTKKPFIEEENPLITACMAGLCPLLYNYTRFAETPSPLLDLGIALSAIIPAALAGYRSRQAKAMLEKQMQAEQDQSENIQ